MQFDSVIFDVDGTMIDSAGAYLEPLVYCLKKYKGIDKTREDLLFTFGMTLDMAVDHFEITESGFIEEWVQLYKEHAKHIVMYDGMEDVLLKLDKAGIKLGIVTSRGSEEMAVDSSLSKVLPLFKSVVTIDRTEAKPSPKPVYLALKEMAANANSTLFIGDSRYDKEAAEAAGLKFALAKYGGVADDRGADFYFENVKDIISTVLG